MAEITNNVDGEIPQQFTLETKSSNRQKSPLPQPKEVNSFYGKQTSDKQNENSSCLNFIKKVKP